MIYALTDNEMLAFAHIAALEANRLSPVADLVADAESIKALATKAEGLLRMGLAEKMLDGYRLTTEGLALAPMVFTPECAASFERRSSNDKTFNALKYKGLWTVHTQWEERKVHLLYTAFSEPLLIRWLDENLLADFQPTDVAPFKSDFSLTYEEWFLFLASQFVFMKRGHTKKGLLYRQYSQLPSTVRKQYYLFYI